MDRDTILGILRRYSPPLTPTQTDEIAEAILSEWKKTARRLEAKLKAKSKSHVVTRSKRRRIR